jgi:hypothetical protein
MSGAIHRGDLSFPVWIAKALGIGAGFHIPSFEGAGGLPVNLEWILGHLSRRFGGKIEWWETVPAMALVRGLLDRVEDYWERGEGALPVVDATTCHNLSVWGFQVGDALTLTEAVIRRSIPEPRDDFLKQVPEMAMYRTARRVLNPALAAAHTTRSQARAAEELAGDGGIENLIVCLGANNVLGTVTSLTIRPSEDSDLNKLAHERICNLFRPLHFAVLYDRLMKSVDRIGPERVFLCTIPHVTIPPVSRGGGNFTDGYYDFYTRPWVWDSDFDPGKHRNLTRQQAESIDSHIDAYNETIASAAEARDNGYLVDLCGLLDDLAFRRSQGRVRYEFPAGLVKALREHEPLRYLVTESDSVSLDTRFLMVNEEQQLVRLSKGGLFSLDGMHPTTIGYGIFACLFLGSMREAGVEFLEPDLDWSGIVRADTLVNDPPPLLDDLRNLLHFLDRGGLLSSLLNLF